MKDPNNLQFFHDLLKLFLLLPGVVEMVKKWFKRH